MLLEIFDQYIAIYQTIQQLYVVLDLRTLHCIGVCIETIQYNVLLGTLIVPRSASTPNSVCPKMTAAQDSSAAHVRLKTPTSANSLNRMRSTLDGILDGLDDDE